MNGVLKLKAEGRAQLIDFQPEGARIYDNGGLTVDRYTLIIDHSVFTMSSAPAHRFGVNLYAGDLDDLPNAVSENDRIAEWSDLNKEVKFAIWQRYFNVKFCAEIYQDEIEKCLVFSPLKGGLKLQIQGLH